MQQVLELDPEDKAGKYRSMDKWAAHTRALHATIMGNKS